MCDGGLKNEPKPPAPHPFPVHYKSDSTFNKLNYGLPFAISAYASVQGCDQALCALLVKWAPGSENLLHTRLAAVGVAGHIDHAAARDVHPPIDHIACKLDFVERACRVNLALHAPAGG